MLDLGCGNGATARFLHQRGYSVTGIDISVSGVAIARESCTECRFEVASVYDNNLVERFGRFDIVLSLEVIEHCPDSYGFMRSVQSLPDRDGVAILSTPYHAFLKNLLILAAGRFEAHFDPLWVGGHLKFFTIPKLRQLIENVGLEPITFVRTGRIPPVAKSVVAALKHRGPTPPAVQKL